MREARRRSQPGPPPVIGGGSGQRPPTGNAPSAEDDDDEFDDIETLGRDYSYDEDDMQLLDAKMRQVSSSNVYGYAFQSETKTMGILYVTFLEHTPKDSGGSGVRGKGPGSTYAYYNFPVRKFKQFESMAETSAGGAVWDYCRVRHSMFEHQHTYRLSDTKGGQYCQHHHGNGNTTTGQRRNLRRRCLMAKRLIIGRPLVANQ